MSFPGARLLLLGQPSSVQLEPEQSDRLLEAGRQRTESKQKWIVQVSQMVRWPGGQVSQVFRRARCSGEPGGQVVRRSGEPGGQVARWPGGQVVRWSGGQVIRVVKWSGKPGGQVIRWPGEPGVSQVIRWSGGPGVQAS